jgi:hypothetical protein
MGSLKNLWIKTKSAGGRRALSRADLFSYCEPLIKNPAAPPELLQAMQESFVRYSGDTISLVEYYRRYHLTPALEKIANEPTWHRQRATLRQFHRRGRRRQRPWPVPRKNEYQKSIWHP